MIQYIGMDFLCDSFSGKAGKFFFLMIILLIRETDVQEDAGIEGILHRLEKHRSLSFGISKQDNGNRIDFSSKANDGHNGYVLPDVGESWISR